MRLLLSTGPAALEPAQAASGAPLHVSTPWLISAPGLWRRRRMESGSRCPHSAPRSPALYLQPSPASKLLLSPQNPALSFLALQPFPSQLCPWV